MNAVCRKNLADLSRSKQKNGRGFDQRIAQGTAQKSREILLAMRFVCPQDIAKLF
jgi:hypothetical protein